MKKRFVSKVLAATMVLGAAGVLTAPAAQARPSTQVTTLLRLHNYDRHDAGARTLRLTSSLSSVARDHSLRMSRSQDLHHSSNLGRKVRDWNILGENVGVGPSIPDLHDAFMDSAPHRRNVLHRKYRDAGVGVVKDSDGMYWVTVIFRG